MILKWEEEVHPKPLALSSFPPGSYVIRSGSLWHSSHRPMGQMVLDDELIWLSS